MTNVTKSNTLIHSLKYWDRVIEEVRNHTTVTELLFDGGRITGVQCGDEEFRGKIVVNAAGAWGAVATRLPTSRRNGRSLM